MNVEGERVDAHGQMKPSKNGAPHTTCTDDIYHLRCIESKTYVTWFVTVIVHDGCVAYLDLMGLDMTQHPIRKRLVRW